MDLGWLIEPLGLVLVAVITVGGSYLTAKASNRSTTHVTEKTVAAQVESSRVVAEEQAFLRAKGFYEGVIDRQDREAAERDEEIRGLKGRVATLENELAKAQHDLTACKRSLRVIRGGEE